MSTSSRRHRQHILMWQNAGEAIHAAFSCCCSMPEYMKFHSLGDMSACSNRGFVVSYVSWSGRPISHLSLAEDGELLYRSVLENSTRNTSTMSVKMLSRAGAKGTMGQCIRCTLPYIRSDIPILIVFRALGFVVSHDSPNPTLQTCESWDYLMGFLAFGYLT